jgi:DNA-3-methyladenine glycosylase I
MPEWHASKPTSLAGYLEAMSRSVFSTGMSWKVMLAKWTGIREAFYDFDPQRVAALSEEDVDRLITDVRIIRNRPKVEAIIHNAGVMIDLERQFGGFDKYLSSHGGFEPTVADLRRHFRFLGESGAYFFLYAVGEPAPRHEEWMASHARKASA